MAYKKRSQEEELIGTIASLVSSAAKDAGWGELDQKPYPSDPKLRNCECVGAFVGSLKRGCREIIKGVGALMAEGKSSAIERADLYKGIGEARLDAATANNGGMVEHAAQDLKQVEAN